MQAKLLRIDLAEKTAHTVTYGEDVLQQFFGGSGLGIKIAMDDADILDPVDPRSPLMFIPGLLTGTPAPSAARTSVCARSPLTGIWGESSVGGYWGAELRFAGLNGLVIVGKAKGPAYLWIDDGEVEFRDAREVWGRTTYETADALVQATHANARVAAIGPAGEKRVPIANIIFGGRHSRAAGRCGMGAVMGSKKLKAVVVRGTSRPEVADRRACPSRTGLAAVGSAAPNASAASRT